MKGFCNSRYMILTLLLIIALIGYFTFSQYLAGPHASKVLGQTGTDTTLQPDPTAPTAQPQAQPPAQYPPDPTQPSQRPIWLTVAGILLAAVLLTFLIARLQRRRSEAYRRAAIQQRDKPPVSPPSDRRS